MSTDLDADALARRVIDGNHYMTLATREPDGGPRVSPVFYSEARYRDFYWVSSPEARHSRNVETAPVVAIVIFDSTVRAGEGEAVYLDAIAERVPEEQLERVVEEAFDPRAGAGAMTPDDLRGDAPLRLYVARVTGCEVHVPGRHPSNPSGIDMRRVARP
ncbi:pyridoxamine 5'-phosphate oxidase family protein [Baekduia sp. Peel2402]|uniref:pyridoxamine 5'-phosphate oxidase family protein n=1 Tax=Baekduia sp. Peel2402 TaxID=3458296 RepID=UPI00403EDDBC